MISSEVTAQPASAGPKRRKGWRRVRAALIFLLVAAGAGEFAVRGVGFGLQPDMSMDLAVVWAQARAWLEGKNPYRHEDLCGVWEDSRQRPPVVLERWGTPALYPPNTFTVLAPIAALPWEVAKRVWLGLNVGALAVLLFVLLDVTGLRGGRGGGDLREPLARRAAIAQWLRARDAERGWGSRRERGWLLVGWTLALAPLHTNVALGQLTLLSLGLGLLGWWASERGWKRLGGATLGLAAALKPQIGTVVLAFAAYRRQWQAAAVAVAVAAAALGVGAGRLQGQGIAWLSDLRANVYDNTHGGSGDPTAGNPLRYQLLNLQYPLHNFTDNRALVSVVTLLVTGGAGLAGMALGLRGRRDKDLLLLGLWLTGSVLVVYHRGYDALVLAIPLAWLVAHGPGGSRAATVVAVAGILAFLLPGASLLQVMVDQGRVGREVAESVLWRHWILPHQVWALVALLLAQLWLLAKRRPGSEGDRSG